jgi:alanine dehydrogenase
MLIGIPSEIKQQEHRVGLVPSSVKEFTANGHQVMVQAGAGLGINFSDQDYKDVGAELVATAEEIFERAEMIIKVKEPQPSEFKLIRKDQIIFTYLHLAADPAQAEALINSGCVAIAYETVTGRNNQGLPLLAPMSEIAGRLSVQVGAYYLQKHKGGTGRLISGVPGVKPAEVLILGGGVAGFNAAQMATGLGANVTILERNNDRMRYLDDYFRGRANVVYSNVDIVERFIQTADLVVGTVLIPGESAPRIITKDMLKTMQKGAVLVDVSIDQGGCFETSHVTTHNEPTYVVDGITHYCVGNMPGAVPLTSALALNHSVLPYALSIANKGWREALLSDSCLRQGLNICQGEVTHSGVAASLDLPFNALPQALSA